MPRSDDISRRNDNDADPSRVDCQFLEDLSTAYWQSEVLFSALELKLFDHIESEPMSTRKLCALSGCREDGLYRLLKVMKRMELVGESEGNWFNSQAARRYLVAKSPSYMGDFFLYRRTMQENFRLLTRKISRNDELEAANCGHLDSSADPAADSVPDDGEDYAVRNFNYVRALDQLAREKAREIVEILLHETWSLPVLDIGGGAGALCRCFAAPLSGADPDQGIRFPASGNGGEGPAEALRGVLLDLPEVIEAARKIYPDETDWKGIETVGADFRFHAFAKERTFGLIVMSNFLHTYGEKEARKLLEKALNLLKPGGKILIHDYFPDRLGRNPQKGPNYDL
ncbi:MAG: class I SAM-dependent methyltransferase, partial [Deltaproteobacteria bacterium]|nr:class I SAM-dependent methyltransferase [Deltaproteobacteria bacterium]